MDTFERRWRLLESLLTGPKTRREIWDELQSGVANEGETGLRCESCLSDDVRVLRNLGIGFRPLGPGDKRTKQAFELEPSLLTLFATGEETAALQIAHQLLHTINFPEAEQLLALIARIPLSVKRGIAEPNLDELLAGRHSPYDPEVIRLIREGSQRGRAMVISYQAVGKPPRRYYIDRSTIVLQDGQLYLLAHCPREPGKEKYLQNREFRLDRFVQIEDFPKVELLASKVREPKIPTFKMKLWLSPYLAPYFTCPTAYKAYTQEDGSKIVMSDEAIALRAIRRILSYAEQAKLLGPDFLIEDLQQTIERMAQNHLNSPLEP